MRSLIRNVSEYVEELWRCIREASEKHGVRYTGSYSDTGVYRFSMHTDTSGPANCGIIHVRTSYGVCQMEKGVKGSGASYAMLFLDYVLWITIIIYLCLTCKLSISLQRNTSSYQGGSRNIFNMQRVSSTPQLKSLAHNL